MFSTLFIKSCGAHTLHSWARVLFMWMLRMKVKEPCFHDRFDVYVYDAAIHYAVYALLHKILKVS